jgi:lysyl-tRNA synthetase class 2
MTDLNELITARKRKLERLALRGVPAYPYRFDFTHRLAAVHAAFAAATAEESPSEVAVCGRLMALRDHGKTAFGHLEDATGRLQVYLRADVLGAEAFAGLQDLDVGDFAGVRGPVFRTRTGELTVKAKVVELLAKSLRPLPEKWHGLKDVDTRFRQRALDLAANPEVRKIFETRTRVVSAIRRCLDALGYLEVETPILQPVYGGADACPFTTWYESLKATNYLRISNELYLKRLLAGGLDRVYEFSKDFRNEGLDRTHQPEFTLLELYEAYTDYHGMMALTETLFREAALAARGEPVLTYQGTRLDFGAPWARIPFVPALAAKLGFDPLAADVAALRLAAENAKVSDTAKLTRPKLLDKLFSVHVQDGIAGPAFVVDHPLELTPLAKAHRTDPRLAERFEPIVAGMELGNAFSELNDPLEQRRRFEAQAALRAQGDAEAQQLDEDFLAVLELGVPPAGGLGIGIDRLVMLACDAPTIREVILFPQLRPESTAEKTGT